MRKTLLIPLLWILVCGLGASELSKPTGGMPIRYGPDRHERELFGYEPAFTPGLVTFDTGNNPYILTSLSTAESVPEIQTLNRSGEWTLLDFEGDLPAGVKPGYYAKSTFYSTVIDEEGDFYILFDGTGAPNGDWYILHSRDKGTTWTPYPLSLGRMPGTPYKGRDPGGCAMIQQNVRKGFIAHPPVVLGNNETHLIMLVPEKASDGSLRIPEPVEVEDIRGDRDLSFDEEWKGSWGGFGSAQGVDSFGDDIFVVWARPLREGGHPGTPMYISRYNRTTGRFVEGPVYIGSNGVEVDSHNRPVIGVDNAGFIHVLLGSHGTIQNNYETVLYSRSANPLDITSFSPPIRLPAAGCTYPDMVIDSEDTLHVVARKYDAEAWVTPEVLDYGYALQKREPGNYEAGFTIYPRSRLAYFRMKKGTSWSYQPLVATYFGSYVFWHGYISLDARDRVFVSYNYSPRIDILENRSGPALLVSYDHGDNWDLATTPDLIPGATERRENARKALQQTAPDAREGGILPIFYEAGKGERELLGYEPGFEPNLVTFDKANRPYIRAWTDNKKTIPAIQTVTREGDVLRLPGPRIPGGYELGPWATWSDYQITFDADGDAYTLIDATGRADGCWLLAHSKDNCRTWKVYRTPLGRMPGRFKNYPLDSANRPYLEYQLGSHKSGYPPVIVGNDTEHLLLVTPLKNVDGSLSFPEPVRLSSVEGDRDIRARNTDIEGFGGMAPGGIVSIKDQIHVAYIRPREVKDLTGTPTYIVTYDRKTGKVTEPLLLDGAGIEIDSHNTPRVISDPEGYLHVILGAHGGRMGQHYKYFRSLKPNDSSSWSQPEAFPSGLTYPAFICDEAGNLHCFSRNHNGDLVYQRRPTGGDWESMRRVVVPKTRLGYFYYFHYLTMDNEGRLFLSYLSMTREFGPYSPQRKIETHGPNLIMSADNGLTWQLATADDFRAPREAHD